MERTARLLRIILYSLPPAPDATIFLPHEVRGAVDDEPGAEVHPAAADQSSPTGRGPSSGSGGAVHHLEGGTGRSAVSDYPEPTGRAAADRDLCKNFAAGEQRYRTDGWLVHHRVPGGQLSGAGRQETRAVAELQEPTTPAASERAGTPEHFAGEDEGGLGGLDGLQTSTSYARYDQYSDLYLYGRPVSDFWADLWAGSPLVFHDAELLSIREYIAGCRRSAFSLDMSSEITAVLDSHPGPISSFRIDSCSWTEGSETLGQWIDMLSARRVHELILVNKLLPTSTVFPIEKLQGPDLTALFVAFMDIPGLTFGAFNYSTLDSLELIGCTYSSSGLLSVLHDCTCLRSLVLGCSNQNISITSQSLMSIQVWNCKAAFLRIDYAPKLLTLATGIRPRDGLLSVMLSVNTVEALAEIRYLMLPFHDLTIRAASVIEGKVALPQVRRLGIGIQMESAHQRNGLVSVLKHMPRITQLILLIVEDSPTDKEYDGSNPGLESLSCLRVSLQSLVVEEFRGGTAEVAVIAGILSKAEKLVEVILELSRSAAAAANDAAKKLGHCPRASIGCRFSLRHPD